MWTKINHTTYNGNLNNYSYPTNKEFGGLLVFLKQIASRENEGITRGTMMGAHVSTNNTVIS
jgi:hypothetical protein